MRLVWRWQSLTAITFFLLNVDLVVMPCLSWLGFDLWTIALLGAVAGTVEPSYWYWYSGWFVRRLKRSDRGLRLERQFRLSGDLQDLERRWLELTDTISDIQDFVAESAEHHLDIDTPAKKHALDALLGFLGRTHIWMTYPVMAGLGLLPFGWLFAIVIHRTRSPRVPEAFILFLAVNAAKTAAIGVGFLLLPLWAKVAILSTVFSIIGWRVRKAVRAIRARRNGA